MSDRAAGPPGAPGAGPGCRDGSTLDCEGRTEDAQAQASKPWNLGPGGYPPKPKTSSDWMVEYERAAEVSARELAMKRELGTSGEHWIVIQGAASFTVAFLAVVVSRPLPPNAREAITCLCEAWLALQREQQS